MIRSAFSPAGGATVPAGQAVTVQLTLGDQNGQPQDLTGRSLSLVVYQDNEGAAIVAQTPFTAVGTLATARLSGAQTIIAFVAQEAGSPLAWTAVEADAQGDPVYYPLATFRVTPAPLGMLGGGITNGPVLSVNVSASGRALSLSYAGPPGLSAAQLVSLALPIELPVPTPAAFTAWLEGKVGAATLAAGIAASTPISPAEIDGTETMLIVRNGQLRAIGFADLALALAQFHTLNFANAGGSAIADATGIL